MNKGPNFSTAKIDALEPVGPMGLPATMPMIMIRYSPVPTRGEDQDIVRHNATFQYVASTKKATVTIERVDFSGTALADLEYVITGAAAKVKWDGFAASALTLKDVMDLFNKLDGITCEVLDAPYSYSFNSTTAFSDVSETTIPSGVGPDTRLETLFGNLSNVKKSFMRIGLPEKFDYGPFQLVEIQARATGVTNGTLKLYEDNYLNFGDDIKYMLQETLLSAQTSYLGYDVLTAPCYKGSVIVEVISDDLSALDLYIHRIQAGLGS